MMTWLDKAIVALTWVAVVEILAAAVLSVV